MKLPLPTYKNGGAYDSEGLRAALGAGVSQVTTGKPIKFALTQDAAKARMVVTQGGSRHALSDLGHTTITVKATSPSYPAVPTQHAQQPLQHVHCYCSQLLKSLRKKQCLKSQPCGMIAELAAVSDQQHATHRRTTVTRAGA